MECMLLLPVLHLSTVVVIVVYSNSIVVNPGYRVHIVVSPQK